MTDRVRPSKNAPGVDYQLSRLIERGASISGYIAAADNPLLADEDSNLSESAMNEFAQSHSSSSFDVTIDPGEAVVHGSMLARDVTTTVTLASNTDNQVVSVGWDRESRDTVIIGLGSDFASVDRKIDIWTFNTDSNGVTYSEDLRDIGKPNVTDEIDTRQAINDLYVQVGKHDFELGLTRLQYDDGQFEVYQNNDNIAASSGVNLVLGLESNGNGYAELGSSSTSGYTTHTQQDMGFVPDEAVVSDELWSSLATDADITYEIEDENGNVVSISRSDIDSVVTLSAIETFGIQTRAKLSRTDTNVSNPQLDAWASYLTGAQPDTYTETSITGTTVTTTNY